MATQGSFEGYPPFPSDIPTAEIRSFTYKAFESATPSSNESEELFEACREQGYFMLELRGSEAGEKLLQEVEAMFSLNIALFEMKHSELLKYHVNIPKDINGYKPPNYTKVDERTTDYIEFYSQSRDQTLGITSKREDPELFTLRREECRQFFLNAHGIINTILAQLDKHLGIATGTLSSLNPLDKPSHTCARLLHSLPPPPSENKVNFGGHTDIGTITMLFNILGGLQVLPAGSENDSDWRYIRPQPGCALINIGDSLVEWSGGILRSALHRVFTPPGEQAKVSRRSVAYLIRPPHNGSMRRLVSEVIPAVTEGAETRSVDDWAMWKLKQIVNGEVKAQTLGGRPIVIKT